MLRAGPKVNMIIAPRMPPQKYQEIVYLIYIDIHEFNQHRFFHIETSCFLQLIHNWDSTEVRPDQNRDFLCKKTGCGRDGDLPQFGGNWWRWLVWLESWDSSGERGNTLEKMNGWNLELHGGERFRWFSYGVGGIWLGWSSRSFSGWSSPTR